MSEERKRPNLLTDTVRNWSISEKLLNCLVFNITESLRPSLLLRVCSYFLIYKIFFPPSRLISPDARGVFPWVWNDLNNVAQTVCRQQRIPGRRAKKHLSLIISHLFLWVVSFSGVNSRVRFMAAEGAVQNQPAINCSWNRSRILFLRDAASPYTCSSCGCFL